MAARYRAGGFGYGHAKERLADALNAHLAAPRERYPRAPRRPVHHGGRPPGRRPPRPLHRARHPRARPRSGRPPEAAALTAPALLSSAPPHEAHDHPARTRPARRPRRGARSRPRVPVGARPGPATPASAAGRGDLLARSAEAPPDDGVALAVQLLRTRQTGQAVALLGRLAQERAVDVRGYDAVAVLYRLASGRAQPGLPTGGALPPAAATAPPAAGGDDLPPPPPSDEVARARIIDGAVERLARWDEAGARGFLDGAMPASPGPTARPWRHCALLARGGVAAPVAPAHGGTSATLVADAAASRATRRHHRGLRGADALRLDGELRAHAGHLGRPRGHRRPPQRAARRAPAGGHHRGPRGRHRARPLARSVRRGRGYAFNSGLVLGSLAGTAAVIYAQPDEAVDGWGSRSAGPPSASGPRSGWRTPSTRSRAR
jgi:hypothetical protein